MKAILVIEMPSACKDCNMSVLGREPHTGQMCFRCAHYPTIMVLTKETKRPEWCPLKPMIDKKSDGETLKVAIENDCYDGTTEDKAYFAGYDKGYNACIDEILGDKE